MKSFNKLTDTEKYSYKIMIERMKQHGNEGKEIEQVLDISQETISKIMELETISPKVIKAIIKPKAKKNQQETKRKA